MHHGQDDRQPKRRRDRVKYGSHVVVSEQAQEIEVELIRVREWILDRESLEELELIAICIEIV